MRRKIQEKKAYKGSNERAAVNKDNAVATWREITVEDHAAVTLWRGHANLLPPQSSPDFGVFEELDFFCATAGGPIGNTLRLSSDRGAADEGEIQSKLTSSISRWMKSIPAFHVTFHLPFVLLRNLFSSSLIHLFCPFLDLIALNI